MKEITVDKNQANQRLDKLLKKLLKEAGAGFIYKMLRKKNIVLNNKKALGSEMLIIGDVVNIYLSDETFSKFAGNTKPADIHITHNFKELIIYEDDNVMLLNKPEGMLSQKASKDDTSINELMIQYMLDEGEITVSELAGFRPSVCNRLDRNTTGIIVCGKSLVGLQEMSAVLGDRSIGKYYLALVKGMITKEAIICGYLSKDEETNKVSINSVRESTEASYIETEYEPLLYNEEYTLLMVHLITGKTHQIRAHLSSVGHALIGDYKYGSREINNKFKNKYGLKSQLLHSYLLDFPQLQGETSNLSGKSFRADMPKKFRTIIGDIKWLHGTPEDLEGLH